MGRLLGAFDMDEENDRPDLNKCPDCGCFFASDNCTICGKPCPEEMKAGNRKPVKKKRRKKSNAYDGRVIFIEWYHSLWFIILMLIFFPLIGFILLFTSPHKKSLKIILAAVFVAYTLVSTFGLSFVDNIIAYLGGVEDSPVKALEKDDYIASCIETEAESFYRMPDAYYEKFVTFTVTVKGKFTDPEKLYSESKYPDYYICTDDGGEFTILVRDCQQYEKMNFVEGDKITLYGEGEGNVSVYDTNYTMHSAPCLNMAYSVLEQ